VRWISINSYTLPLPLPLRVKNLASCRGFSRSRYLMASFSSTRQTLQPSVTQTVMLKRLRFFGHVIRSDPDEDHTRALNAGMNDPPKEWRRPRGRPRQTWLHTIENDLKHQNLGLWSARTERSTVICGMISWKWRCSCRGMLHDDND